MQLNHKETITTIPRFILSSIILIVSLNIFNHILPVNSSSRLVQLLNLAISGIICGGIYLIINLKNIQTILPSRILEKLHIKKEQ